MAETSTTSETTASEIAIEAAPSTATTKALEPTSLETATVESAELNTSAVQTNETMSITDINVVSELGEEFEQVSAVYQMIVEFFVNYSFQIIGAIIIMLLGLIVARKVGGMVERFCLKKKLDVTLSGFIASSVKIFVVVMVAIIALGKIGISVTPFLAAIGALSLGAGLAVQGLLMNYGAGLNIIITRPFVVGDTIEVQDVCGLVKTVHMAYTILIDEDGTEITIPNRHIVGEIIHNSYTNMLAEINIGIAYSEDAPRAIEIIKQAINSVEELQNIKMPVDADGVPKTEQKTQVGIDGFGSSGVKLSVRAWLPTPKFHRLRFKLNAAIYAALNEKGVKIPFPQHEVRMLND